MFNMHDTYITHKIYVIYIIIYMTQYITIKARRVPARRWYRLITAPQFRARSRSVMKLFIPFFSCLLFYSVYCRYFFFGPFFFILWLFYSVYCNYLFRYLIPFFAVLFFPLFLFFYFAVILLCLFYSV